MTENDGFDAFLAHLAAEFRQRERERLRIAAEFRAIAAETVRLRATFWGSIGIAIH
jgi:hypothetical protein